jgi:hypothetical protein
LLILRELVGAGYFGTAVILSIAFIGFKQRLPGNEVRLFWALYVIVPIVLAVLADAASGYFFAIRQVIFVLAPLSLLTALGIERLAQYRQGVAVAICSVLIAVFVFADVHFFFRPREDWGAAATVLRTLITRSSCIQFVPPESSELYRFFVPELGRHACSSNFKESRVIAVAISPYGSSAADTALKLLHKSGFHKTNEFNRQGPKINVYTRDP